MKQRQNDVHSHEFYKNIIYQSQAIALNSKLNSKANADMLNTSSFPTASPY